MSRLTGVRRALGGVSQLSRAQGGLSAVIVAAPVLAWGCSLAAGAALSRWTLLVVVVLTLLTAVRPDSNSGLSTVLFLGWYWFTHVPAGDPVSPWILGAGLCVLAFHTATAARASAPGPADLDHAFWRRWLRRVVVIATATAGVWGLTGAMASPHHGSEGLALAAFAALVGGTAYARLALIRGR